MFSDLNDPRVSNMHTSHIYILYSTNLAVPLTYTLKGTYALAAAMFYKLLLVFETDFNPGT